jgi:hypothetical protein
MPFFTEDCVSHAKGAGEIAGASRSVIAFG